ncbi:MAG: insulinase family protein [Phycisphaerales bacterium]|nr:MAG: insulinase family protein [Phycisphaerales bacterium]
MGDIRTIRLDCGMPLLVEPNAGVRSAGLSWLFQGGSASDPEGRLGLCAMLHELLLRGSRSLDSRAQADAFDRLGVNRSTDALTRHYRVAATLVGDRLLEALPLIVGMVREPAFAEGSVGPVRELCLQSIESLADDPQERCVLGAKARHHPEPINRSGYGTPEGLAAITRDDLAAHWSACAVPEGSVLAVAGAVDPDAVAQRLNELLDGWRGRRDEPALGATPARGYAHEADESNQVQIVLVHDAPPEAHEDAILERTVVSVLSGGMSGRLFSEVREKRGLCYAVSCAYRADRDRGTVTAYVGTTPDRAEESLRVLRAELERVHEASGRITPEEFERAKVGMKSRLVFSGESTSARAGAMAGDWTRLGRARTLEDVASEIDAVTLDRVNDYLSRRRLGTLTIQTVGPRALG